MHPSLDSSSAGHAQAVGNNRLRSRQVTVSRCVLFGSSTCGFTRHSPFKPEPATPPCFSQPNVTPSPPRIQAVSGRQRHARKAIQCRNADSGAQESRSSAIRPARPQSPRRSSDVRSAQTVMPVPRLARWPRIGVSDQGSARYSRRGMATSASWKITYRARCTIFAPICRQKLTGWPRVRLNGRNSRLDSAGGVMLV